MQSSVIRNRFVFGSIHIFYTSKFFASHSFSHIDGPGEKSPTRDFRFYMKCIKMICIRYRCDEVKRTEQILFLLIRFQTFLDGECFTIF